MSAIWGNLSFSGTLPENIDTLMRMPYETKCKIDRMESIKKESCYFGCGIQYITGEATQEILPLYDEENNILLTADCCLDNREELLTSLALTDNKIPDGNLIHLAYLKWGIDCVKHFRGLFSIAILDYDTQTLYLVSDHTSARCLYYYHTKNGVTFSTLLAPILALHGEIVPNELYLKDYLAAPLLLPTIVVEETPYKDVYKLPPATILQISGETVTKTTYWTPAEPLPGCQCKTAKEYGSYFRTLLTDCVNDAIRTSGKVGIALSSGLDSSSVGTIAADLLREKNETLFAGTYIPYEEVPANTAHNIYNESEDVKSVIAMHPNIVPHFLCNQGKNALSSVADGLDTLEIPYKAFVNYPTLQEIYTLASKEGCLVMLSGQMGNSTISYGNMDHVFYHLYEKKKYPTLLKWLNNLALHMKLPRKKFIPSYLRYLKEVATEYKNGTSTDYTLLNPYLNNLFAEKYPVKNRFDLGRMEFFSPLPNTPEVYRNQLCFLGGSTYMGEWETKIGLKHGILLRDPTKDIRILSFCYHLPYRYFAYKGTTKWLIRGNMKDMLPAHILNQWDRHGKQNEDWYLRILRDYKDIKPHFDKLLGNPELEKYIDTQKIRSLLNEPVSSLSDLDANTRLHLFIVYVFAMYINKF